MASGHPAGVPIDLFREHLDSNVGSFTGTAAIDSDFFRETANLAGMPARTGHNPDQTAYSTQPATDSWQSQVRGWCRIGNLSTTGQGNLT